MNYPEPRKSYRSALLSNIIRLGVAGGLIWWLVNSGSIKLEYLTVPADRIYLLCFAALLQLSAMGMSGLRYKWLLRGSGVEYSFFKSQKSCALMYFFSQCVLGPASGDMARFIYTARSTGKQAATGAAIMVDRLIGTMGLFLLAAAGLSMNWTLVEASSVLRLVALPLLALFSGLWLGFILGFLSLIKGRKAAICAGIPFPILALLLCLGNNREFFGNEVSPLLLAAALASFTAPVLARELLEGGIIREKVFRGTKLGEKIGELLSALLVYRNNTSALVRTMILTAMQHMFFICALYLFALSQQLPVSPGFTEIFFAAPLAFLAGIVPAPAAGLGVNEAAFETLIKIISHDTVTAGASIYLMFRIWMTIFSLAGLPVMLKSPLKKVAS